MGKPHPVNQDDRALLSTEYTQGSETSQYLEEQKLKSIP